MSFQVFRFLFLPRVDDFLHVDYVLRLLDRDISRHLGTASESSLTELIPDFDDLESSVFSDPAKTGAYNYTRAGKDNSDYFHPSPLLSSLYVPHLLHELSAKTT